MSDPRSWHPMGGDPPPCTVATGGKLIDYNADAQTVRMSFEAPIAFTSPRGSIQGGFVAAFVDEVIGTPVFMAHEGKVAPLTLDLSLSYISPVMPGKLIGEGQIVKMGRKIAFTEAQLYDAAGTLLVKATSTVKLTPTGV